MGRRLCIYGFCRSIEMLSDVVEDTVLEHGGEVNVISLVRYLRTSLHKSVIFAKAFHFSFNFLPCYILRAGERTKIGPVLIIEEQTNKQAIS